MATLGSIGDPIESRAKFSSYLFHYTLLKKNLSSCPNIKEYYISHPGQQLLNATLGMKPVTGLGLLLIQQFVEENIEVKSTKNKGSEFIVYFKPSSNSVTN